MEYTDVNAGVIDSWCRDGWTWGKPITHEIYERALRGEWDVLLTPTKPVPHDWFPELSGKSVLGLASGGGQQMPVFSALGAKCTVLDYSKEQLASEKEVALREKYRIEIVRADMTRHLPFEAERFDVIFHPVSNCYIKDVQHVWNECFRVLKPGGVLLAGLDIGLAYAFNDEGTEIVHTLPYDPLQDEKLMQEAMATNSGVQFSHTIEEQLGGQLKAGFILKDIFGDTDGSGNLHDHNIVTFYATLAVKP